MAAPGETKLDNLLATLSPRMSDETYVFLSFKSLSDIGIDEKSLLDIAVMVFQEPEALTAIVDVDSAVRMGFCSFDAHHQAASSDTESIQVAMPCRMVEMQVQSSLEAVGMMAAISTALAAAQLPCNVVAGFLHDYLFVPVGREAEAMAVLENLQREARFG